MMPDEAVEAAAEAINEFAARYVGVLDPVPLKDMSLLDRERARGEARAALEAAAPYIIAGYIREMNLRAIAYELETPLLFKKGTDAPNPYRSQA
jgi:hypothetical protein